jgi:hypothetical protein
MKYWMIANIQTAGVISIELLLISRCSVFRVYAVGQNSSVCWHGEDEGFINNKVQSLLNCFEICITVYRTISWHLIKVGARSIGACILILGIKEIEEIDVRYFSASSSEEEQCLGNNFKTKAWCLLETFVYPCGSCQYVYTSKTESKEMYCLQSFKQNNTNVKCVMKYRKNSLSPSDFTVATVVSAANL